MKKSSVYILYLAMMFSNICDAQKTSLAPLQTGNIVPDVAFDLHTESQVLKTYLSDFKGKLIILDFWDIECTSCIAAMPEMLKVQQEFGDKLKIILVTGDKEKDIENLWKKLKGRVQGNVLNAYAKLPGIVHDSVFAQMFPHTVVPLHVWIDSNLMFRGEEYNNFTTSIYIQNFLDGKRTELAKYVLPDIKNEQLKTWVEQRIGFSDHLLEYSFCTKFDEKVQAAGGFKTQLINDERSKKNIGINCFNVSIPELYRFAYYKDQNNKLHHIVFEGNDLNKYVQPPPNSLEADTWREINTYCYAMKASPLETADLFKLMQNDLDRFFSLDSKIENRNLKCWILKRISTEDKIHSISSVNRYEILADYDSKKLICNREPMKSLFDAIYNNYHPTGELAPPFLDETNYTGNIDIELKLGDDNYSLSKLRSQLQKYGLDIVEEYRPMDVLVLKEKGYKLQSTVH